jgi:hypothetical protein
MPGVHRFYSSLSMRRTTLSTAIGPCDCALPRYRDVLAACKMILAAGKTGPLDVPTKEAHQSRATRMMRFVPQRILWPFVLDTPIGVLFCTYAVCKMHFTALSCCLSMPLATKPVGICNPVRNVLCHIGCHDFAQNVSGGVTNPAAPISIPRHASLSCPAKYRNFTGHTSIATWKNCYIV